MAIPAIDIIMLSLQFKISRIVVELRFVDAEQDGAGRVRHVGIGRHAELRQDLLVAAAARAEAGLPRHARARWRDATVCDDNP